MRYALISLGTAALVAAGPALQPIDFNAVVAAPSPSLTGPPVGVAVQTDVYDSDSASASAVAAVTGIATASATASVAARDIGGGLQERNFCIFGFCFGNPTTTTSASTSTSTGTKAATTTTSTTAAPLVTVPALANVIPTTCTPISWTNTFAFITTDTACPQPYEVGTYCGFINPEDPCAPQPGGYGLQVLGDASSFQSSAPLHQLALKAADPSGYVNTFKDYNASVNANSYLGLQTLTSYDVAGCAAACDSTSLCTAFNIYIERNPSVNPDQCSCSNPVSITNFKCTLWGSGVAPAAAVNAGQARGAFQVVIVGSNGYEKTNVTTPSVPSGWTKPQNCSGSAHNHGSTCIGQKFFPGPYNPSVCATFANTQNSKNKNVFAAWWAMFTGYNPSKCNFFNAYMLKENGIAKGTYCSLFAQQYEPAQATYRPGWVNSKFYNVESSWSFCSK